MVPMAAISASFWGWDERCDGAHLEYDDGSTTALADDAVAGDVDPVVAAPEGVSDDTRVPYECDHDSRISVDGTGGGDTGCT